jgi:hypothetical protein
MTTFDGRDLFGAGPSSVRALSWQRHAERRSLPGLCGELIVDQGLRSRAIVQHGRLCADTAAELHGALAAIEAMIDGLPHVLIDNHGRRHERAVLESFEQLTPVQRGRGFWCDYTATYRELP